MQGHLIDGFGPDTPAASADSPRTEESVAPVADPLAPAELAQTNDGAAPGEAGADPREDAKVAAVDEPSAPGDPAEAEVLAAPGERQEDPQEEALAAPDAGLAPALVVAGDDAQGAKPKSHKKKKKHHKMRIEHQTRGRVRMKFASAKGDPAILQEIGETFGVIPGVQRVKVNPETGSVVLHYDPERHADFHRHFDRHCDAAFPAPPPTQIDELASKIEREAEFLAEHSHTAKAIVHICKRFDRQIKQKTNNAIDLKIGFGAALIGFTLLEVGASAATPIWLTLGVFTLNHFVEMQTRHDLETRMRKHERETAPVVVKGQKTS